MFRALLPTKRTIGELDKVLKRLSWESVRPTGTAELMPDRYGLFTVKSGRNLSPAEIAYYVSRITTYEVRQRLLAQFEKELWRAVDERNDQLTAAQ